jgi:hypothetical protein
LPSKFDGRLCADKARGTTAAGALIAYVRETQRAALPAGHLLHDRTGFTRDRGGKIIAFVTTRHQ